MISLSRTVPKIGQKSQICMVSSTTKTSVAHNKYFSEEMHLEPCSSHSTWSMVFSCPELLHWWNIRQHTEETISINGEFLTRLKNLERIQSGETSRGILASTDCLDIKCVEGRDDTTRTSACKILLKCLKSNISENSLWYRKKTIIYRWGYEISSMGEQIQPLYRQIVKKYCFYDKLKGFLETKNVNSESYQILKEIIPGKKLLSWLII